MCDDTPQDRSPRIKQDITHKTVTLLETLASLSGFCPFISTLFLALIAFAIAHQPQGLTDQCIHPAGYRQAHIMMLYTQISEEQGRDQTPAESQPGFKKIIWTSLEGKGIIVLYVEVYNQSYCFNFKSSTFGVWVWFLFLWRELKTQ